MSLESLVHDHVAGRLRPRTERAGEAARTAVAEPVGVLPGGSMRVLEGLVALASIVTALLIGVR